MKFSAWIVLVYALLILLGGLMGFRQAHSLASLVVGSVSAIILLVCASGMFRKSLLAYTLAMAFILVLTLFFAYRFALTEKFMPAGMMTMISALALLTVVFRSKKKKAKFS